MSFALQAKPALVPPPPRLLARHRGVSFHEERFSWLRYEGEHLFQPHYREASADLSVPLDVNWEIYERAEQAGIETCVVARRNSVPVGYVVYFMCPSLHYSYVVADADVFYLDPAFRKGWLAMRMFGVAEALLKEKGVSEIWTRVKLHVKPGRGSRDAGVLFRYLGYRPVETNYRKRIA
jgi:GNAT superfamily N-acetyltransferase